MKSLRPPLSLATSLLLSASAVAAQSAVPTASIDSVFAQYNRSDRPGCALGVYQRGQIVYSRGYGMADLNQGVAITPQTVFYIASTSKQFAAASLTILAMQGKVSLDDPVRKYVPELPAYADGIKLHHLMHHVSGVRDYLGLWGMSGRSFADDIPEEAALDLIARQKALDFEPGSGWSYSNSGYFLISVVVKRASGLSLAEYAHRNIFEPLGMRDTHFHDDRTTIVPRRAEGYEPDGSGGYRIVRTSFALVGDGGLYTTIDDLAKWDENFFNNRLVGGGQELIGRLTTRGVLANGDTTDYAAGLFSHTYRGLPTIDHGGAFIGYRAELLRFPTEHTSIGILCNDYSAAPEQLAKQVANATLGSRLQSADTSTTAQAHGGIHVDAVKLERYAGRFEVMPGMVATVIRDGAGLAVQAFGRRAKLVATSDSTFIAELVPGILTFHTLGDGRIAMRTSAVGMDSPALAPAPTLSAAERQGIVGRYYSDELQATYAVKDTDGRLMVRGGYGEWMPLQPFRPEQFAIAGGRVTVERDRVGRVSALRLDAARMRNIRFVRLP